MMSPMDSRLPKSSTTDSDSHCAAIISAMAEANTMPPMSKTRRLRYSTPAVAKGPPSDREATLESGVPSSTAIGMIASRTTVATTAMTAKCHKGGTCQCDAAMPMARPSAMPTENPAWNWGMIDLPTRRSTSAASALAGTLDSANARLTKKLATAKNTGDPTHVESPSDTRAARCAKLTHHSSALEPNLALAPVSYTH